MAGKGLEAMEGNSKASAFNVCPKYLRLNTDVNGDFKNHREDYGCFPRHLAELVCNPDHELTAEEIEEIKTELDKGDVDNILTMKGLVQNILDGLGIRVPLVVKKQGEILLVTAGHRRTTALWIADRIFGVTVESVKANSEPQHIDPFARLDLQYFENQGNKPLTEIEQCALFQSYQRQGLNEVQIGARLGLGVPKVKQVLSLVALDPKSKELVVNGTVSPTTAINLIRDVNQETDHDPVATTKIVAEVLETAVQEAKAAGKPKATGTRVKKVKDALSPEALTNKLKDASSALLHLDWDTISELDKSKALQALEKALKTVGFNQCAG